jgi:hypothetical protein
MKKSVVPVLVTWVAAGALLAMVACTNNKKGAGTSIQKVAAPKGAIGDKQHTQQTGDPLDVATTTSAGKSNIDLGYKPQAGQSVKYDTPNFLDTFDQFFKSLDQTSASTPAEVQDTQIPFTQAKGEDGLQYVDFDGRDFLMANELSSAQQQTKEEAALRFAMNKRLFSAYLEYSPTKKTSVLKMLTLQKMSESQSVRRYVKYEGKMDETGVMNFTSSADDVKRDFNISGMIKCESDVAQCSSAVLRIARMNENNQAEQAAAILRMVRLGTPTQLTLNGNTLPYQVAARVESFALADGISSIVVKFVFKEVSAVTSDTTQASSASAKSYVEVLTVQSKFARPSDTSDVDIPMTVISTDVHADKSSNGQVTGQQRNSVASQMDIHLVSAPGDGTFAVQLVPRQGGDPILMQFKPIH